MTTGKQLEKIFIQLKLAFSNRSILLVGGHRNLCTHEDQLASILKIEKMKDSIKEEKEEED